MFYGLIAGAAFVFGGAVAYALRKAKAKWRPTGEPTTGEAKISASVQAKAGELAAKGERKLAEVAHASADELLDKFRDSMRDNKPE